MSVAAAADALYELDPDDFIPARTAAVLAAKQAGDRALATELAALKKPTRSAWLVNLVLHDVPGAGDELAALAAELLGAHAEADFVAVRSLDGRRNRLVAELTGRALALGLERGYSVGEPVKGEVTDTFVAATADPEVLAQLRTGRLTKAQRYSGFGLPMAPPLAPVVGEAAGPAPAEPPAVAERAALVVRAEELTAAHAAAERRLAAAGETHAGAQAVLDRASQEVADLRAELRAAEAAELAARERLGEAADPLHEARTVRQVADQALADVRRRLAPS